MLDNTAHFNMPTALETELATLARKFKPVSRVWNNIMADAVCGGVIFEPDMARADFEAALARMGTELRELLREATADLLFSDERE